VAETFASNGEGWPKYESIIFEICIDESQHEDMPVIFADIASASVNKDEHEVLMSIDTRYSSIWRKKCTRLIQSPIFDSWKKIIFLHRQTKEKPCKQFTNSEK
jgi:hypothetical protein